MTGSASQSRPRWVVEGRSSQRSRWRRRSTHRTRADARIDCALWILNNARYGYEYRVRKQGGNRG